MEVLDEALLEQIAGGTAMAYVCFSTSNARFANTHCPGADGVFVTTCMTETMKHDGEAKLELGGLLSLGKSSGLLSVESKRAVVHGVGGCRHSYFYYNGTQVFLSA